MHKTGARGMSCAMGQYVPNAESVLTVTALQLGARLLGSLGARVLTMIAHLGRVSIFLLQSAAGLFQRPFRPQLLIEQIHFIGRRSVNLIVLTSAFTGMVLALQSYNALQRFGSETFIGPLVALSLLKELGPVLAALMVTARAASATTASLGNMRATEQIEALTSMAVDPVQYLVSPRLGAAVVSVPIVTAIFSLSGICFGYLFCVSILGIDGGLFMESVRESVAWSDVREGLLKSTVFGVLIAWVSCYRGFFCTGGAAGIGRATARAVVDISAVVLVGDYVMTALLF